MQDVLFEFYDAILDAQLATGRSWAQDDRKKRRRKRKAPVKVPVEVQEIPAAPMTPSVSTVSSGDITLDGKDMVQAVTSKEKWQHSIKKTVRFLTEHAPVDVHFVSSQDPSLQTILDNMADGNPMALDLEWFCWAKPQVINCYQICSTRGVLVIHDINPTPNQIIREFLSADSGNKFVAKGCSCDYRMLHDRFGPTFRICMEDVEITRLKPNNLSLNFIQMVETFAGPSTASFKNKKVSMSNWSAPELSTQQVLYAAFDAFSLYKCIPNFPQPSGDPYERSIPMKLRQAISGKQTNMSQGQLNTRNGKRGAPKPKRMSS